MCWRIRRKGCCWSSPQRSDSFVLTYPKRICLGSCPLWNWRPLFEKSWILHCNVTIARMTYSGNFSICFQRQQVSLFALIDPIVSILLTSDRKSFHWAIFTEFPWPPLPIFKIYDVLLVWNSQVTLTFTCLGYIKSTVVIPMPFLIVSA